MARHKGNSDQGSPSPFSFGSRGADTDLQAPGQSVSAADDGPKGSPFGMQGSASSSAPGMQAVQTPGQGLDSSAVISYDASPFGRRDEVSDYAAQMNARHVSDRHNAVIVGSAVLAVVLVFLVALLPSGLFGPGKPDITIAYLIEAFSRNVTGFANWVTGGPVTTGISITFWQVLAVAVAGAALALNGCVYQGALRNPLAAPSTLGVTSGATLGTIIYTLMFMATASESQVIVIRSSEVQSQIEQLDVFEYLFLVSGRALFSIVGCFAVVALILVIAHIAGGGKVSKVALLIAGQVFAALITGVIAFLRTYLMHYGTEEQQEALMSIVGGNVSSIASPLMFALLAIPVLVGVIIIFVMRFKLNLLAFNDDETKAMGVNSTATRNGVIIVCTLLTGVVISFVGSVGFVGFLVPHLARRIVGPNFRYLVPASAIFGAIFLLLAYYLMNLTSLFSGSLGTLTSIVGAVFFLVVVIRERARGNVDWI